MIGRFLSSEKAYAEAQKYAADKTGLSEVGINDTGNLALWFANPQKGSVSDYATAENYQGIPIGLDVARFDIDHQTKFGETIYTDTPERVIALIERAEMIANKRRRRSLLPRKIAGLAVAATFTFGVVASLPEVIYEIEDGSPCQNGDGRIALTPDELRELRKQEFTALEAAGGLMGGVKFYAESHPANVNVTTVEEWKQAYELGNEMYTRSAYHSPLPCEYSEDGSESDVIGYSIDTERPKDLWELNLFINTMQERAQQDQG